MFDSHEFNYMFIYWYMLKASFKCVEEYYSTADIARRSLKFNVVNKRDH